MAGQAVSKIAPATPRQASDDDEDEASPMLIATAFRRLELLSNAAVTVRAEMWMWMQLRMRMHCTRKS